MQGELGRGGGRLSDRRARLGWQAYLIDRLLIGKLAKCKKASSQKQNLFPEGGKRGEGFSFELTSSAAAAGKFVMRNIHLAQLFGLVLALLHVVVVVVHCAIFICSQKFLGLHRRRRRRPFRHLHFGSNGNFEFELRFFFRFSVLRLTVGALQSDR